MVVPFFLSARLKLCPSDSLGVILPHLSTRVMNVLANGNYLHHLYYLLRFLAAWKERPECLTPMAYQWCPAVVEATQRLKQRVILASRQRSPLRQMLYQLALGLPQDPASRPPSDSFEESFSGVGPGCDSLRLDLRLDDTSGHFFGGILERTALCPLSTTMEIGFRLIGPRGRQLNVRLEHTPHHDLMFKTASPSADDDVIADFACAWLANLDREPVGSCMRYFAERVESAAPFSQRLRWASIQVIGRVLDSELEVSGLEVVRLLHRLDVDTGDIGSGDQWGWAELLVKVVRSLGGFMNLSSHYWGLLDKLVLGGYGTYFSPRDVKVMKLLEGVKDWEKLEVWILVLWRCYDGPMSKPIEDKSMEDHKLTKSIERSTLTLSKQRPSALLKLERLANLPRGAKDALRRICDRAREQQSLPKSPPPPCVLFILSSAFQF